MSEPSTSQQKAKEKEIAEPEPPISVNEEEEGDHSGSEGSEDEQEQDAAGSSTAQAATPSTSSKKKKKKRSKALKALNALRGGGKDAIPEDVVKIVLDKVRAEGGEAAAHADPETIRMALEQMKIKDVIQGKSGIGGKNKKDMGGHKFWGTQPVPQLGEAPPEVDGPIEPSQPREEVRQEPYPLPKEFMWSILDLNDAAQLRELYELLSANYVEDDDASFRFQYSAEFLSWALKPPGYHKDWHIGVRVSSTKRLVAFISAVPIRLRVRDKYFDASEVNFLCVHKKLRSKRLTPVLIKEVTRQCHLQGVFQALYTAGVLLPTPVSTCRYYHRCLNIPKLVSVRFTGVPPNMTLARMIRLHKVPDRPRLLDHGLREMEERDVPQVSDLFNRYMQRFQMVPVMSEEEVRHQFLSGLGEGPRGSGSWKQKRDGQVVWTYVVENPKTKKITDFISFYSLPSTIMNSDKYNLLNAAYLFYYGTETAFEPDAEESGRLKKRLQDLIGDALVIANAADFDVFNALTLMDNACFLQDLKFGQGDGLLNFYLYNWRTAPLAGMNAVGDTPAGRGVGVVML
ncbi:N-myristoyl transferase [Trametes coccinea BRFM310]|uniref:Glycylpeptide N-tetradecanoyltransferase n=1 Tax=Trametes coccinea (strain BRFM310) TaxID=1353009 RepID=A0A1Y2J5C8_TRAC3|nr:N-myristoyl transferase [Trametes coccinea BRFM310]